MATVSIRDLGRNPSRVIAEVTSTGRPALVTKNGAPVAAVVPIDQDALAAWVLASAGDPPIGTSLEESPEAVLRKARPIPDFGHRAIPGLTEREFEDFWQALNSC